VHGIVKVLSDEVPHRPPEEIRGRSGHEGHAARTIYRHEPVARPRSAGFGLAREIPRVRCDGLAARVVHREADDPDGLPHLPQRLDHRSHPAAVPLEIERYDFSGQCPAVRVDGREIGLDPEQVRERGASKILRIRSDGYELGARRVIHTQRRVRRPQNGRHLIE
jgi:hypothetical protein